MKNTLLLLALLLLSFLSFAQSGPGSGVGSFYDGTSFLSTNSDFTEMVDTGNYKIWDSTVTSYYWNKSGFYGTKVNDSLYYGVTMSNIELDSITEFNYHKASVCGIGADSSENYGVVHGTDYGADIDFYIGVRGYHPAGLYHIYVTNAAITAKSIMYGDSLSKKFGGIDGTDPDWLKLSILFYNDGNLLDSIDVYLADFRSPDSTSDYVLKDWIDIEPDFFIKMDSISFKLSSSDVDSFGNMRTPDYFCIDNLYIEGGGGIENIKNKIDASIFPNPTNDVVNIISKISVDVSLYHINGKLLFQKENCNRINLTNYSPGTYLLKIRNRKSQAESNYTILRNY